MGELGGLEKFKGDDDEWIDVYEFLSEHGMSAGNIAEQWEECRYAKIVLSPTEGSVADSDQPVVTYCNGCMAELVKSGQRFWLYNVVYGGRESLGLSCDGCGVKGRDVKI